MTIASSLMRKDTSNKYDETVVNMQTKKQKTQGAQLRSFYFQVQLVVALVVDKQKASLM